jgi:hypothetical protein
MRRNTPGGRIIARRVGGVRAAALSHNQRITRVAPTDRGRLQTKRSRT